MATGLFVGRARAQEAVVSQAMSTDAADADAVAALEGYGYALTPGVVTHPSIGIQAGATDNVFYQTRKEDNVDAGILRVAAGIFAATDKVKPGDEDTNQSPRAYEFRAGLQASFEQFLSDRDSALSQHELSLNGAGDVVVNPAGDFAFLARDHFVRDIRPPNYEDSSSTNRDDNTIALGIRWQPYGHDISASLRYENWISIFEGGLPSNFANRINHTIALGADWQWRPFTKFSGEVSYGFYGPLGTSTLNGMPFKTDSQPLRAVVGMSTLLSTATTLKLHAGYTRASYGQGEGYSAPVGGVEFGYRWSDTGRLVALYDYDHFDSFNANFYADHTFGLKMVQQLGASVLDLGGNIKLRNFGGIPAALGEPERFDFVTGALVRWQMVFSDKYVLSAEYRLDLVQTTYRANVFSSMGTVAGRDDPSFTRNEVDVGFRAAF